MLDDRLEIQQATPASRCLPVRQTPPVRPVRSQRIEVREMQGASLPRDFHSAYLAYRKVDVQAHTPVGVLPQKPFDQVRVKSPALSNRIGFSS